MNGRTVCLASILMTMAIAGQAADDIGCLFPLCREWAGEMELPAPHGIGAALAVLGVGLIALSLRLGPWSALARVPDGEADVARHGLLATLLLHWARWRACLRRWRWCWPASRRPSPEFLADSPQTFCHRP